MAIKCNKCNRQITRSEDHITCSAQCGGNYHLFCVNLDEDTFNRLKKSKQISTWCCNLCGVNRIAGAASNVLDSLTSSSLSESCLEDMLHKVFSVYVDPIMVQLDTLNAQVTKLTAENKSLRDEVFSLNQVIRNTSQTGLSKLNEQDLNNKRSYAESLREKSAESIIVKPKDKEQSVTKTKSDVIRSIDALNSSVHIGKVKNLKEGAVLLGLSSCDFDLIALSETWLHSGVFNSELFNSNYLVVRKDRDFLNTNKSRGGGVLIGIKSNLIFSEVDLSIVIYIPPSLPLEYYHQIFDAFVMLDSAYNSNVVIIGDFNIPEFFASVDGLISGKSLALSSLMDTLNVKQYNNILNKNNRLLDLVLTNTSCSVLKSDDPLVEEDPVHPSLIVSILVKTSSDNFLHAITNETSYNFRKANYVALYHDILNIDWSFLRNCCDANAACHLFYNVLYEFFDKHVPKYKKKKYAYPIWFTPQLISKIRLKNKTRKKYLKYGNPADELIFKELRREIKRATLAAHKKFVDEAENRINTDPTKFWQYIRYKRRGTGIPACMTFNDTTISGPENIVNAFARFYESIYIPTSTCRVDEFESDRMGFCVSLHTTNENKGPDGIPAFVIKDCASVLAEPLSILFNLSISTETYPDQLKVSKIIPVYKGKSRSALYPQVSHSISQHQHGFIQGRSTTTNLFDITGFIANSIDNELQTDVIYLDFSRAFDRLDHGVLIKKLYSRGFTPNLFTCLPRVPQGSVLGPLLFLLFIDDITAGLNVSYSLYADDVKVFNKIATVEDCIKLHLNLNKITTWCDLNKLVLNKDKCRAMSYSLKKKIIFFNYALDAIILSKPETISDLGVIFDPKLSFASHINKLISDCRKTMGFIIRNARDFQNAHTITRLFKSFLESKLYYACLIWCPHHNIYVTNLERIIRKFLKYLSYREDGVYPPIGMPQQDLLNRYNFTSFLNTYCPIILSQITFNVSSRSVLSRYYDLFYLPVPRTDIAKFSPMFTMCRIGNVFHREVDLFSSSLRERPFLLNHADFVTVIYQVTASDESNDLILGSTTLANGFNILSPRNGDHRNGFNILSRRNGETVCHVNSRKFRYIDE
ncbi:uncharacterized protein LOC135144722 [Zophobas morio]|uniref:uncharacterized protein LOC135144722 n=1 Tax=Zophobas morio TaxID=2755281 RepID=UPI003082C6DB